MAQKTMLRQLISKWGIMSIDLQTAIDKDMTVLHEDDKDMTVLHEDGSVDYVENQVEAEENVAVEQEYKEVPAESEATANGQEILEDAFFRQ